MRKFGIDIMLSRTNNRKKLGRILLPVAGNMANWHDILYVEADDGPAGYHDDEILNNTGVEPDTRKPARRSTTTAKLMCDQRGSYKKDTEHIRIDAALPAEQDSWEIELFLGMNPENQPVCRVALPENNLCEIYRTGDNITLRHNGMSETGHGSCSAEHKNRLVYAAIKGNRLFVSVTDTERLHSACRQRHRRYNANRKKVGMNVQTA